MGYASIYGYIQVQVIIFSIYYYNIPVWWTLAVLTRGKDDPVGVEELDSLQTELENLLAAAAKRMLQLKGEIETLSTWQEKGKDKKIGGKVVRM